VNKIHLDKGLVVGTSDHGNAISVSIKAGEYVD
jgi:hypothetical protein